MESSALIMLKGWQPECSPYCIKFCSRLTEIGPVYTILVVDVISQLSYILAELL